MSLENHLLHLQVEGWCIVKGVIPVEEVDGVRRSVEKTVTTHRRPDTPAGVDQVPGLIRQDQSFAPYLAHGEITGITERLFGEHFRISMTSGMVNHPGNSRTGLHADWPFNQKNASHIPSPYPGFVMHLTTIWMLTEFTAENGGTIVVPGSHRMKQNPTGDMGIDPMEPYSTEIQITGAAGSVMVFDSRLWHAAGANQSARTRVAMAIRYAPWWLNLDPMRPGSADRARMVEEPGKTENLVPLVPRSVFDELPGRVKPLYRHWVE